MKATFAPGEHRNGKNLGVFKEMVGSDVVIALKNKMIIEAVTARYYMGRSRTASTVHATLWVHGAADRSGSGEADGYGYHKQSAALANAIRAAGIRLDKNIHGAGDSAIREALLAVARAAGYRGQMYVVHT